MIRNFTVEGFRGFRKLDIGPLAQINLVAGRNSVGKTSLLEALFLLLGPNNPELPRLVNAFRTEPLSPKLGVSLTMLFHELSARTILLTSRDEQKHVRTLKIRPSRRGLTRIKRETAEPYVARGSLSTAADLQGLTLIYREGRGRQHESRLLISGDIVRFEKAHVELPPGIYLSSTRRLGGDDVERFSDLQRRGREGELLETLRLLEPRISRLMILVTGGTPVIHADIGFGELLPIQVLGEGLARLLGLVAAIGAARGGTVLIDEVENGFHHSALVDVWTAVGVAARRARTQVIATTHSRECIEAAQAALGKRREGEFRLHRLERIGTDVEAITYDRKTLNAALAADFEVR